MHRTTAHQCFIIAAFLYPIAHSQSASLQSEGGVTVDAASCQNPSPGYTLDTIDQALAEAFDMAEYVTNFVGTNDAFLNYRAHDTFLTLLGSSQNSPVAYKARGES